MPGCLAALLALAAALALTPAVQRWAILQAAAAHPGWHLQLDGVSAGPRSFTVSGLRLQTAGLTVACGRIEGDYSPFQFLFGSRLVIDRMTATGLTIDATRVSRNRVLAGVVAAPAALVRVDLPWELAVGDLRLEGQAELPGAPGRPSLRADFKLAGGELSPGREGAFRLTAHVVDPRPGARVEALDVQAGLHLRQALARRFDRVRLTALVDATGPRLPDRNELKFVAELSRVLTGEDYLLHVDTLNEGRAEDVLVITARQPQGAGALAGEWALTAHSAQIEPFVLGGPLPRFDARGRGRFSLRAATRELALSGSLEAGASELEVLRPALRALGPIKLASEFDVAADREAVHLNKLELTLAGEQPVADLHAAGAVGFSLKERRLLLGGATGPVGEVLRLRLAGLPLAWLRPFITAADVSGGCVTGELALVSGADGGLLVRTEAPLRAAGVTVVRAGRNLLTQADLALDAEAELHPTEARLQLRAFQLTTPAGDAVKATATLAAPLVPGAPVAVAGEFTADLPALLAPWLAAGHLRLAGGVDGTWASGRIELRKLNLEAADGQGQRLAAGGLVRGFGFDWAQGVADTGAGEVELARGSLGRLPVGGLARARPFGFSIKGTTAPDDFVLVADDGRLSLRARSPLLVSEASVARDRRPLLEHVSVEFSPVIALDRGGLARLATGDGLVRDATGAPLAKFNAEWTRADGAGPRGSLAFSVDLSALAGQPLLGRAGRLTSGQASGEIRTAALGAGGLQVEARATLNGLAAAGESKTLPVANLSFRGVTQPDGKFSAQLPVLLDSAGHRSDLNLSVEGAHGGGRLSFDARLTGERVDWGDAALLVSAFAGTFGVEPGGAGDAERRALSPPAADERPPWAGLEGRLTFDLKSVQDGRDWAMSGVAGEVALSSERLELKELKAGFGGGSGLSARGELAFGAGPEPYHLAGELSLADFDLGRFFRAIEPDRPPTVEGICTLHGRFEGGGLTPADTVDRTHGRFEVASRHGVFRGLRRGGDKLSMASKAVQWSAALGSLLKTGRVKEAAEKVAGSGYFVDQLADSLAEIKYDQLDFKLSRDAGLNLLLQDLSLVAPDVHLRGSGQVTWTADQPVAEQPLSLSLTLAARGRVEQILGKLKLLDGTRDDLDYARVKVAVTVAGTLLRPDAQGYYASVLSAKPGE